MEAELIRTRLQQTVRANPGIHTAQAALVIGIAWNTCHHHIRVLERRGALVQTKINGKNRLFDRSNGRVPHKEAASCLRDGTNRRLAAYVLKYPGRSQRDLAGALDMSTTAIHRRLSRLEEAGLLQRLAAGRTTLVHANDAMADAYVEAGLRSPPARQAEFSITEAPALKQTVVAETGVLATA